MALTATATPRVRADIMQQLAMTKETKWFLSSFNRTNLQVTFNFLSSVQSNV
jgi:bloom syndrome protein